ncbi:MAG TPA: hypothetical protein VIO94_07285 [Phenylobacterium sp.]
MTSYRVYFAREDGRLDQGAVFDCASDEEALARVRELKAPPGCAIELWRGGRMVLRIPAVR